jgi:hypothetical protein
MEINSRSRISQQFLFTKSLNMTAEICGLIAVVQAMAHSNVSSLFENH